MGEIRAFSEEYLDDIADLYLKAMRGQNRKAPQSLKDYFRDILLNNPWVTPEIPSIMYLDGGRPVGFMGVIPRPMQFKGQPIRAGVGAQFFVDRKLHRGPAAIEILRAFLRGPQEITFTDGSGEDSSIVWRAVGAQVARMQSFNWMRILRPIEAGRAMFDRTGGTVSGLKGISGLLARPLDNLVSKLPVSMLKPPRSRYSTRLAEVDELFECIQELNWREPLKPAYRLAEFRWLIGQALRVNNLGKLRLLTVHAPDGSRCGSLVYYAKPRGSAYVLQIGWRRRDHFPEILSALFADAYEQGQYAVKGQAIPQFIVQMSEQYCIFRQLNACVVGHSRNPEIFDAFVSGNNAMSRLDGECWLRFPLENWTS